MATEKLSPLQQELLSRADSILSKISEVATKGSEIVMEQLPDIVVQYINYHRAYYTFIIVMCLILFCLITYGIIRLWTKRKNSNSHSERDDCEISIVLLCLTYVFPLIPFSFNLKNFIMVWVAPKIFIITEISRLIHK